MPGRPAPEENRARRRSAVNSQRDDHGDADEERLLGPLGPDQAGAEQDADREHQPSDEEPGQKRALVGQASCGRPGGRSASVLGRGGCTGDVAEDRKGGLSLQSIWPGSSTSPDAATAPSIPGITTDPGRAGGGRTTRAGARPTPARACRCAWSTSSRRPSAARRCGGSWRSSGSPTGEGGDGDRADHGRGTDSAGFRPEALRISAPAGAKQHARVVRAQPRGVRDRGPRSAAGAGRGDGRAAGAPGPRDRPATRGARSSASTATCASRPTSRRTRPTPPASSTISDAGRGAGQDAEGAGAGLYFQLADGECFVAGGIWMPARPALEKIREALADDPGGMDAVVRAPAFRRRFGALDREAMLTRLPARVRGRPPGRAVAALPARSQRPGR